MDEWEEDEFGFFKKGANLKATGNNAPREKRPNLYYPIFIKKNGEVYVTENNKMRDKGKERGDLMIFPITGGKKMSWRWSKNKINTELHNLIVILNGEDCGIYKKQRPKFGDLPSKKPKSIFYKPEYSSGNGTGLLKKMFGEKIFNNPKPIELIKDFIRIGCPSDGVILDFFAGTGTTGHAVMQLNIDDGGKRQFILCTNDENKIMSEVCYPRIKMVIDGYVGIEGLNSSVS
jgi:adenine-specific DNA-methyltransferase